jgi:pimeloyl-ACP methyl ester carboxylesterase
LREADVAWHWVERGSGRPLVLLHGLGETSAAWQPVIGRLAMKRRVIVFDLPGFGRTPVLGPEVPPTPAGFASLLPDAFEEARVTEPPDLAGHSMGGWIALEAARAGTARSVVALAPSGLWRNMMPARTRLLLSLDRWTVRNAPGLTGRVLRNTAGRTLTTFGMYGRPWAVPAAAAVEAAHGLGAAPGFSSAFEGHARQRFRGGADIRVPVTVAFGTRDAILGKRTARFRDELPVSHRFVTLPRCGHAPMWDDPELVACVILEGTS